MRLPLLLVLIVCALGACNSFATDKKEEHPEKKPHHKLEDNEFQKLRKRQDSILETRQKKPKFNHLDILKPKQA